MMRGGDAAGSGYGNVRNKGEMKTCITNQVLLNLFITPILEQTTEYIYIYVIYVFNNALPGHFLTRMKMVIRTRWNLKSLYVLTWEFGNNISIYIYIYMYMDM